MSRVASANPVAEAVGLDPAAVAELVADLRALGETVATAESLTGGLLGAVLTGVPGASSVVRGGLIVYDTRLKTELAGVDADLLARHGAVHPAVAAALAEGARDRCGASWGLGLTGVAGPDPQDDVEPGTVHIGLAGPTRPAPTRPALTLPGPIPSETTLSETDPFEPSLSEPVMCTVVTSGDRHAVRAAAVRAAVHLLRIRHGGS